MLTVLTGLVLAASVRGDAAISRDPVPPDRPRLIVTTDISSLQAGTAEPDDAQSLIRLLLYSNDIDVRGLIATRTTHDGKVHPDLIHTAVAGYREVRPNLVLHDPRFPTASDLLSSVKSGLPDTESIGEGLDSEGSDWIISVVDGPDPRPVWVTIWGGPRELAQALWKVGRTRSAEEAARFRTRLRVYAINDQDPTGPWIRATCPDLFYITARNVYRGMYRDGNPELVSPEWVTADVTTGHGPLGAIYPNYDGGDPWGRVRGIKEGDTPSFLYLIPNGLSDPEQPSWGSWGGRFTSGGPHYSDAADALDGGPNERATVHRWRAEYQSDFQARLDWCVLPPKKANHHPVARVSGALIRTVAPGTRVELDASGSSDPDGDRLSYRWWQYREAGSYDSLVSVGDPASPATAFTAPRVESAQTIHIILTVTDSGSPPLSAYRRVVVTVDPALVPARGNQAVTPGR